MVTTSISWNETFWEALAEVIEKRRQAQELQRELRSAGKKDTAGLARMDLSILPNLRVYIELSLKIDVWNDRPFVREFLEERVDTLVPSPECDCPPETREFIEECVQFIRRVLSLG